MNKNKRIWISWLCHRRNVELSIEFRCKLYQLRYNGNKLLRYLILSFKTIRIIYIERPFLVFSQNPSLVLPILLLIIQKYFKFKLVVDAHNAGLFPIEGKYRILNFISRIVQRKAHLTVVTNSVLEKLVRQNKGKVFILPDKIPYIPKRKKLYLKGLHNFLLVSSFSLDEPLFEVIDAFRELPKTFYLYISGNFKKARIKQENIPDNVIFTGFIPDNEYEKLIQSVDAVINLTLRNNCLLCGAYESVSVLKPLILTDNSLLVNFFNKGSVYVENNKNAIKYGVLRTISENSLLKNEIKVFKRDYTSKWIKRKLLFEKIIEHDI